MDFQRFKLKNGMTVLFEKRDVPVVSLAIANKFGASHETAEIKGIAHFIEHLLFTGTKNRTSEEISSEIEKRGGILNAFTSEDVTAFWFKLPSEHLMIGLEILTDMVKNPTFNVEKFEKERKVILEEIKMYHDDPKSHVYEKIQENLYEKPFGIGVIGTKETLSSLKRDFVSSYFKEKYSPENYIVTIVGDADIDKVKKYLEKSFQPEGKKYESLKIKLKKGLHTVEERSGLDQAHLLIGFHAPESTSKEIYTLAVLNSYLADGMSSKLFLEIREKRGLAYTVRGSISNEKSFSYYTIYVGTTKEALEEVKKVILKEFENIEKMSQKELEDIKERLIGLKKISSEESFNVLYSLLFKEIETGNAQEYYEFDERIKQVTLQQVKSLAKTIIKEYSTAAIVPKDS